MVGDPFSVAAELISKSDDLPHRRPEQIVQLFRRDHRFKKVGKIHLGKVLTREPSPVGILPLRAEEIEQSCWRMM